MISRGKCFTNGGRTYWFPTITPKPKELRKVGFAEVTDSDAVEFNKDEMVSAIRARLSARRPTPRKTVVEDERVDNTAT